MATAAGAVPDNDATAATFITDKPSVATKVCSRVEAGGAGDESVFMCFHFKRARQGEIRVALSSS
jgi:hypothetical protein